MKIGDKMEYIQIEHTFEPVWNKCSRILILGTFPSVKSRENQLASPEPVLESVGCFDRKYGAPDH